MAEDRQKRTYIVALSTSFCIFIALISTAFTGVPGGDSGELISEICTVGVPHPPGYPLHTVLGGLFLKLIPIGTPAWKINTLSCLCGAISSFFMFLAVERLSKSLYPRPSA
jgi:hypothetical protein